MKKKIESKEDAGFAFMQSLAKDSKKTTFMDKAKPHTSTPCVIPGFRLAVGEDIPHGTMIIAHGPAKGGKTALSCLLIRSFQDVNYPAKFNDVECSADLKSWMAALGVDMSRCLYSRGLSLERLILEFDDDLIKYQKALDAGEVPEGMSMIHVTDSLTMSGTSAYKKKLREAHKGSTQEQERKIGKRGYSDAALMQTEWLKDLIPMFDSTNNTGVFILHDRKNTNKTMSWEPDTVMAGPSVLTFANTLTIKVRANQWKEGDEVVGKKHIVKIEKNKFGIDNNVFDFYTSKGIVSPLGYDEFKTYLEFCITNEIITKDGAKIHWLGTEWKNHREFRNAFNEDAELKKNLKKQVREFEVSK